MAVLWTGHQFKRVICHLLGKGTGCEFGGATEPHYFPQILVEARS